MRRTFSFSLFVLFVSESIFLVVYEYVLTYYVHVETAVIVENLEKMGKKSKGGKFQRNDVSPRTFIRTRNAFRLRGSFSYEEGGETRKEGRRGWRIIRVT